VLPRYRPLSPEGSEGIKGRRESQSIGGEEGVVKEGGAGESEDRERRNGRDALTS